MTKGRSCTTAAPRPSVRPIERHGNEAELARRGYVGLSSQERLLAFLRSL